MNRPEVFLAVAVALVVLGVVRLLFTRDLVRQVLALNVAGSGVLLLLAVVAARSDADTPDPVPHALVLTGIVVAVSVTAVALGLARRIETAPDEKIRDETTADETIRDDTPRNGPHGERR